MGRVKMGKFKTVLLFIAVIVVMGIPAMSAFGLMLLFEAVTQPEIRNDISQYDKAYYIETYGGDLNSNLAVFPDEILSDMEVLEFSSSFELGMLDSYGYILLDVKLDEELFADEVDRLGAIEQKIINHDGEYFVNTSKYLEDDYAFPAYTTIDGYRCTYEYALIDEENWRIIYIYITYLESSGFDYDEYLKLDRTEYEQEDQLEGYSIYVHSFDNGETYMQVGDGE